MKKRLYLLFSCLIMVSILLITAGCGPGDETEPAVPTEAPDVTEPTSVPDVEDEPVVIRFGWGEEHDRPE